MLPVHIKAPAFTLPDQDGRSVSLSDFLGRKVILYFYSHDNTSGCTREALAFAKAYAAFESKNVAVIGVSKDSSASHKKFAEKHQLPFLLLSDPERRVLEAYEVWKEKSGGKMGVERSTYLIDENGEIELSMVKVSPDINASELLAYLTEGSVS